MNKSINVVYAGMHLAVIKNAEGDEVTPLKPISDLFGLSWTDQHKKLRNSAWLSRFWGVCIGDIPHASGQNRDQTCIKLIHVSSFISSINPDRVRAAGNEGGADFLEKKSLEWAMALHDYETLGEAINLNHIKHKDAVCRQASALTRIINSKLRTKNAADINALSMAASKVAAELGIPYQVDLLDERVTVKSTVTAEKNNEQLDLEGL